MKTLLKILAAFLILVFVFFVLQFLVHTIPTQKLSENIVKSSEIIQKEGLYPKILNFKLFQLDNFTDAMMLNIAASADSEHPLQASMVNDYWRSENFLMLGSDTEQVAKGDKTGLRKVSYGRYWQGYLVFLRPALLLFDYSQIRIIHFLLLFSLLAISGFLIYTKLSPQIFLAFLASMILINFPIVPLSMQFSTVFYIALISIIVILKYQHQFSDQDMFLVLFFTIGGLTSFLDFLTAPLITLGIPIVIYVLSQKGNSKIPYVIKGSVVWGIGYASIWASKWILGGLITNVDILSSAVKSTAQRTSNDYRGMDMTLTNIFKFIRETIIEMNLVPFFWVGIALLFVLISFYILLLKKDKPVLKQNLYLLLVAGMVPVWYLVLRNHSIQHGWFTWRALIVPLFAGILFIMNTTSFKNLNTIIKSLKLNKDEKR